MFRYIEASSYILLLILAAIWLSLHKLWGADEFQNRYGTTTITIAIQRAVFGIGVDGLAVEDFNNDKLGAACAGWCFIGNNQANFMFDYAPAGFQYIIIAY